MSDYLLYNGRFHKNSEPLVTADNRGLRYGDGLFETMKWAAGNIRLAGWHFERLFNGLQLLQFELPAYFTAQWLTSQVEALCKKNGHKTARVRINVIRGNGGLYYAENHLPNCIIQSWPLPVEEFRLNENGLVTGIYQQARKTIDAFAAIKSNNYLPYTMAALFAKKNRWNDALVLNSAERICDATIANVFIIKNETIYTCPLQEGCVAGIMRRFLIENLPLNSFHFQEKQISVEDLLAADEVFLSNCIKGISWVRECNHAVYTNKLTTAVYNKLLKK